MFLTILGHQIKNKIQKRKHLYIIKLYMIKMVVNQTILIGLGIIMGIYLLYKLLLNRSRTNDDEYQRLYNKVLTSKEYKVKGQYDK